MKEQDWSDLPNTTCAILMDMLGSIEVKTMRLVCIKWRATVDSALLSLTPRHLSQALACESFSAFPLLRRLDCSRLVGLSEMQLSAVARLPSLQHLIVRSNHRSNDKSLAALAKATGLSFLQFSNAKGVTDDGLSALTVLSKLEVLSLAGADSLQGWGLTELKGLHQLKGLDLQGCCSFDFQGLLAIAELTQITSLDLARCQRLNFGHTNCSEAFTTLVASIPGLKSLSLHWCPWPQAGSVDLCLTRLTALTKLDIGSSGLRHCVQEGSLGMLTTLRWLNIAGAVDSRHCHSYLAGLKALEYLDISSRSQCIELDVLKRVLVQLSSLRTLLLLHIPFTEYMLEEIVENLPALQSLQASGLGGSLCNLSLTEAIRSDLKELAFTGSVRISHRTGQQFQHFTSLRRLNLSNNSFMDCGIAKWLPPLRHLEELNLRRCRSMSDRTVHYLGLLPQLKSLDLCGNEISTGIAELSPLTALTYLGLGFTLMTNTELLALQELQNLRTLLANDTYINDRGLKYLSKMTALQKLDIKGTMTSETGISKHLLDLANQHSLAKIVVPRMVPPECVAAIMPCTRIQTFSD